MIKFFKRFKEEHPDVYNLVTRALWTFLEVFLAVVIEALIALPESSVGLKATFIVAMSAGLSAIKTMILDYIKKKANAKEKLEDEGDA